MSQQNTNDNVILDCYRNGINLKCTVDQATDLAAKSNFVWIVPLDHYQWNVDGHSGQSSLYDKVKSKALRLAYAVHTTPKPVTILEAEERINNNYPLDMSVYATWPYKFHALFRNGNEFPRECFPLTHVKVPRIMGILDPAYRLNPDMEVFLINGVHEESEGDFDDWALFLAD